MKLNYFSILNDILTFARGSHYRSLTAPLYVVIGKTPLKEKAGNDWLFP